MPNSIQSRVIYHLTVAAESLGEVEKLLASSTIIEDKDRYMEVKSMRLKIKSEIISLTTPPTQNT